MAIGDDPTFGTSSVIGRYFGVVSTLPSVILTFWVYALLTIQPWNGGSLLSRMLPGGPVEQLTRVIVLLVVALAIAVASHPIQFVLVQLLEGYWGKSRTARAWAAKRMLAHLKVRDAADRLLEDAGSLIYPTNESDLLAGVEFRNPARQVAISEIVQRSADRRGAAMVYASYPIARRVMPTRLGNVLKKYESTAGSAIGLDLVKWASHIGMVADPSHTAYVQDQRQRLDLAVRMTIVGLICSVATIMVAWPHGLWALVALLPFGMAWLSYRGALAAAASYGQALTAWLHLNRFQLYDRLGLDRPASSSAERLQNKKLVALWRGSPAYRQAFSRLEGKTQPQGKDAEPHPG